MARSLGEGAYRPKSYPRETHLRYSTKDGRLLYASEPDDGKPYQGWGLPMAKHVDFRTGDDTHGGRMMVEATYVTSGPTFSARRAADNLNFRMYSERKNVEHELQHSALQHLRAAVAAHNTVVQPIDNGPDDRVYLSETGHRVAEAVRAACEGPGAGDATELQAACRANLYAADIVIANFNHHTAKD